MTRRDPERCQVQRQSVTHPAVLARSEIGGGGIDREHDAERRNRHGDRRTDQEYDREEASRTRHRLRERIGRGEVDLKFRAPPRHANASARLLR